MSKKITLNDKDRRQWVANEEGLYNWWKSSKMGLYRFVRENRKELTTIIMRELSREPVS